MVSTLGDVALEGQLRDVLLGEGGSLGVRSTTVDRYASTRTFERVEIDGQPLRVKVSPGRAKVEHDDASAAAKLLGMPVREVVSRAEAAWRERVDHAHDQPEDSSASGDEDDQA